jgi:hypothetical protein
MQVINPMMQMNQHHNQVGFAQGQSNQFGRQATPCHQQLNQFPPQFNNFQGNQGYGQMNGCMMNGGMVQYGMMNQIGFQNPNQMGFNQFNGFKQKIKQEKEELNSIIELDGGSDDDDSDYDDVEE